MPTTYFLTNYWRLEGHSSIAERDLLKYCFKLPKRVLHNKRTSLRIKTSLLSSNFKLTFIED